ncbi:MAG: NAD(P)/FAD-dependent oxidoreductase [Clostridiales bacterium]|nr:NAD(P)/FAD-dependent oxidoreductase [Clostridiales bacterium]
MHDLIIVGGGPAGYRAAELAAGENLKTLLFEERRLGGVCLNEGCIPSKALLFSAKLYDYAKGGAASYGVTCNSAAIDYAAAVRHKDKAVDLLVGSIETSLTKKGVEIIRERAAIQGRDKGVFVVNSHRAPSLLLCSGATPTLPPIAGIESAMTNREILALTEIPETLAIVGGGAAGLEMASLFNSVGCKVTVYEMLDRIAGTFDREISGMLQGICERRGIVFHLNAKVNGISELNADKVLVSIGRKPSTEGLGLENINVHTERGAIVTDDFMKTSQPGVYAAGDVNGKSMLAHTAYREAEVAINNICGKKDMMDYSAIPSVIYTNPEAAGIGETLESAIAKGIEARETKLPMGYSGRYLAENEGMDGICKLVWDRNRLVGAHMLGNPCSEVISTLSAVMHTKMGAEQIKKIVFPHPTVAEIVKEAVYHA